MHKWIGPALIIATLLIGGFARYTAMRNEISAVEARLTAALRDVRSDLKADIARVDGRVDKVSSDLNQFYRLYGELDGRVKAVEQH